MVWWSKKSVKSQHIALLLPSTGSQLWQLRPRTICDSACTIQTASLKQRNCHIHKVFFHQFCITGFIFESQKRKAKTVRVQNILIISPVSVPQTHHSMLGFPPMKTMTRLGDPNLWPCPGRPFQGFPQPKGNIRHTFCGVSFSWKFERIRSQDALVP